MFVIYGRLTEILEGKAALWFGKVDEPYVELKPVPHHPSRLELVQEFHSNTRLKSK